MQEGFYKKMEKDIVEWEKKYPGKQYSPKTIKEHEEIRKRWAKGR